jgi:hypothetical protein
MPLPLAEAYSLGELLKKKNPDTFLSWTRDNSVCGCAIGGILLANKAETELKAEATKPIFWALGAYVVGGGPPTGLTTTAAVRLMKSIYPWFDHVHEREITMMYAQVCDGFTPSERLYARLAAMELAHTPKMLPETTTVMEQPHDSERDTLYNPASARELTTT